jgi:hypothetical protein
MFPMAKKYHAQICPVCLFLLAFMLQMAYPAQNNNDKSYKIVLKSGREIACAYYYEKDGQIIVVRPFGEVAYSKEDVVEIRDESISSNAPSAVSVSGNVNPGNLSNGNQCKTNPTLWFQSELRKLPRNAIAANARIDELIAQEKARITELERQLPALKQKESAAQNDTNSDQKSNRGLTGEDVIAVSRQAVGIATVGGPIRGTIEIENPARFQRKAAENEISRCQCNIFWAEKKRAELKK